jgi:hypothetical protein
MGMNLLLLLEPAVLAGRVLLVEFEALCFLVREQTDLDF